MGYCSAHNTQIHRFDQVNSGLKDGTQRCGVVVQEVHGVGQAI